MGQIWTITLNGWRGGLIGIAHWKGCCEFYGDFPSQRIMESLPTLLPTTYEFCGIEHLVIVIADMMSEATQKTDQFAPRGGILTRFHSRTAPEISIVDYLQRLAKYAMLTPALLLSMVYYMDRLCSLYPAFTVTSLTIHRFLATAATVAAKGLSDSHYNNAMYAWVSGITVPELQRLELEFLDRVDWKIVPDPEVLVDYYRSLVGRADRYILKSDALLMEQKNKAVVSIAKFNIERADVEGEMWEAEEDQMC